jgi:hypothetical protein
LRNSSFAKIFFSSLISRVFPSSAIEFVEKELGIAKPKPPELEGQIKEVLR